MGFAKNKRSSPAPRAPPPAAPAARPMAPPPAAPTAAPMAPASQGPSMMGTFGSSMAGSVAGNMIANTMFGGRGEAPAPAAPAPAGYAPPAAASPVCFFESRQFLECMTQAGEDINYCRQYYDAFKMCNSQAQMQ